MIALVLAAVLAQSDDPLLVDRPDAGYLAPMLYAEFARVELPDGGQVQVSGWYAMSPGRTVAVGQVVDGVAKGPPVWAVVVMSVLSAAATGFATYESGRAAGLWK